MAESTVSTDLLKGWQNYQDHLVAAVRPLSDGQLALQAAPGLRTIGELAAHIAATRAGWLRKVLGEGPDEFMSLHDWDIEGAPFRNSAELVGALERTWQVIADRLARWTQADLNEVLTRTSEEGTESITRGWVVWHLIEHDLHHGGEFSFSLGMRGLPGVDIE